MATRKSLTATASEHRRLPTQGPRITSRPLGPPVIPGAPRNKPCAGHCLLSPPRAAECRLFASIAAPPPPEIDVRLTPHVEVGGLVQRPGDAAPPCFEIIGVGNFPRAFPPSASRVDATSGKVGYAQLMRNDEVHCSTACILCTTSRATHRSRHAWKSVVISPDTFERAISTGRE